MKISKELLLLTIRILSIAVAFLVIALIISLTACSETKTDQADNLAQLENNSLNTLVDGVAYSVTDCPNPSFTRSIVNGITFYAGNYRIDQAGKLAVDFCFDQIDTGDWIIDASHIVDRQGHNAYISESELLEIHFPPTLIDGELKQEILDVRGGSQDVKHYYIAAEPDQTVGRRFVSAIYELPAEFDLTSFTVVVESMRAEPSESELCSNIHIARLQQELDERQTDIKIELKTHRSAGGGMCGYDVVEKPTDMSYEEAMLIVGRIDLYGIRGPWVFWGNIK